MKARPILFSAPMVRAILDGRKTQTRRLVKPQPADDIQPVTLPNASAQAWRSSLSHRFGMSTTHICPYGQPGDRLWVRETWAFWDGGEHARRLGGGVTFRADCLDRSGRERGDGLRARLDFGVKWRPSIHMPRWASRITLEVVSVRVERLQDITEADAIAEGIERVHGRDVPAAMGGGVTPWRCYLDEGEWYSSPITSFRSLWDSINGPGSWAANPWVWRVEFKRVTE